MPYATPAHIEALPGLGDLAGQDEHIAMLLSDAEDLVALRRDLPGRVAAGRTTDGLIRRVVTEMVAAVLRNPDCYTYEQSSETTGPYTTSSSRSLNAAAASGLLRLTKEQRAMLGDKTGGGIRTAAPGVRTMGVHPYGHHYLDHLT